MHRRPANRGAPRNNQEWWPEQLDVSVLRRNELLASARPTTTTTTSSCSDGYAQRFAKLDLSAVERDLHQLMTSSVDWWPADYGHYGPFFVRCVVVTVIQSLY